MTDINILPNTRKIIHIDMDAFYASVEIRDNPALAGKPVIIGGLPSSRGVVATASYEARKFGIRSAMSSSIAARICPSAIFLKPDFEKYKAVSNQIHEIFGRYTNIIEPIALDEAYLDVTNPPCGSYAVQIAKKIHENIREELGLSCSAGIAGNKMLAKIASDLRKPGGISVILPDQVEDFMRHLPLRKINGVGTATEKKLLAHGLSTCKDAWDAGLNKLTQIFGQRMGTWLNERSRGIDMRPVQTSRIRKSIGCEKTFPKDAIGADEVKKELTAVALDLARRLERRNACGHTITLKVRYSDFTQVTRALTSSHTFKSGNPTAIIDCAQKLIEKTEAATRPVRLIGLSLKLSYD
jgi:DNA polymerase-4